MEENMISMKVMKVKNEIIVAACDRELLGRTLREGKLKLEITPRFYHESFVNEVTFLSALKIATIANLVGARVVSIAIKEGYIKKENILYISSVPHAQFAVML